MADMAGMTTFEGDVRVRGQLIASGIPLPDNAVGDDQVSAANPITADKLIHQHMPTMAQPNTAAATETRVIHIARGPGSVVAFRAGSIAKAVGDSTVTVDLKKNGTTVLSSVITLDSANTNRVAEAGTLSGTPTVVDGDVLEVVITATVGTGTLPTGVFCQVITREEGS